MRMKWKKRGEHMIKINMLSSADKIKGQGVGSAYQELVHLMEKDQNQTFQLMINQNKEADITHYHTVDFKYYLSTFALKKRGVKVGYVHFLPETLEGSLKLPYFVRKIFSVYLIAFYKKMDWLVVVNPTFIPKLEALGLKKERIKYIPNFVSKEDFYPMEETDRVKRRKMYGIPKEAFVVVGAGQIQYRKGIIDFIQVAKQLPHVHFIWVGGFSFGKITDGYQELKKIVEHPPKNVRFTGIIDRKKMNEYYNLADVLFLPSYNELFPMTILEAMNSGLPLVLRNLELYSAILEGYYLKGENVRDFMDILQLLEIDTQEYQTAKEKAAKGAAYYSQERLWEIWKDFYHEISRNENTSQ